jgi:hypothetical protein
VEAILFIGIVVGGIFAVELGRRWWRENEWKRRRRKPPDD